MYLDRQLESSVMQANKGFPVVLVTGPRQVGKSTMLKHLMAGERRYITLDDPRIKQAAVNSPATFFQLYPPPLLIDEVQYAPQLFPYIKIYVDQRDEAGLFWLTGSQLFQLMENVRESLAGRVAVMSLFSLSYGELTGNHSPPFPPAREDLIDRWGICRETGFQTIGQRIFEGGMPRLVLHRDIEAGQFFSSYLQSYLEKDVRDITHILDMNTFVRFVQLLATRTAQELNLTSVASAAGVDGTTARRWLNILLLTGMVFELPAWSGNIGKRLIKRPKLYFSDTGVCSFLCGFETADEALDGPMGGALFETYVVSEVIKSWAHAGRRPPVYYIRDSNQNEIDLIIERNQKLYPFEIKKGSQPSRPFKNWSLLKEKASAIGYSGLICTSEELFPAGDDRWIIPWQMI